MKGLIGAINCGCGRQHGITEYEYMALIAKPGQPSEDTSPFTIKCECGTIIKGKIMMVIDSIDNPSDEMFEE